MHPNAFKQPHAAPPKPRTPYFCHALLAICVGLFAVEFLLIDLPQGRGIAGLVLGHNAPFPLYGPAVASGMWWLIPLSALEHGGLVHLFFNMSIVVTLGRSYESAIGTGRFAVISLASMLGATMLQLAVNFEAASVGASGMILGWVGAMLPIATQAHRRDLVTWLVQIAIISLLPFVSWSGHLGGFLAGIPCGLLLRLGPTWFKRFAPLVIAVVLAGNWIAVQRGAQSTETTPGQRR